MTGKLQVVVHVHDLRLCSKILIN